MADKLAAFYEGIHHKPLAEPTNEKDVQNILECIRAQHGYLDENDHLRLSKTDDSSFIVKMNMIAEEARAILAQYTKTISSQLYSDPSRFFLELLQNADDAEYHKDDHKPAVLFTISPKELTVDLNEIGFLKEDVVAICATGRSSKKLDEKTTGEKGFGFKSVFGVANRVHIQSGLWSFRFEHERHQDGMGMISPHWEPRKDLPDGIKTRIKLTFSDLADVTLEELCAQLDSLPPSFIFALRKLEKVSIKFDNVEGRNFEKHFQREDKKISEHNYLRKITTVIAGKTAEHAYRIFTSKVSNMPKQPERDQSESEITIGFPLTKSYDGVLRGSPDGQYFFAYLPVKQLPQLSFLIHADFLLAGGRQDVLNNPWNRKLRDEIARSFANAAKHFAMEKTKLSYDWLEYVPTQSLSDFWEPFPDLVRKSLSTSAIFYSRSDLLHIPNALRVLPRYFMHDDEPLLSTSKQSWQFLSARYSGLHDPVLEFLKIGQLLDDEALQLLDDDLSSDSSTLRSTSLSDTWHDSFWSFVRHFVTSKTPNYKEKIENKQILPVRVATELKWWRPMQTIYFPTLVDEGSGSEQIKLIMPTDLGFVVVHPDAATSSTRLQVFKLLGVRICSPQAICNAIGIAQSAGGTKFSDDLLGHLQLLFWFHKSSITEPRKNLVARKIGGGYRPTTDLYMRSDHPFHAENLLNLARNPKYEEHFLHNMYQTSTVSSRSRGGYTWEQWLSTIASIKWYPPLVESVSATELHWMVELIRKDNPALFIPMLQKYWPEDYSKTCSTEIKRALQKCEVLCRNGEFTELKETWFPSPLICEAAENFGVAEKLSILTLPDSDKGQLISRWSCLDELGVKSNLSLLFYREALSLLSATNDALEINVDKMCLLYQNMGNLVTAQDQSNLKMEFQNNSLVWDPSKQKWQKLDDCIWASPVALNCRFVITSVYKESDVSALFKTHLATSAITVPCLMEELQYIKHNWSTQLNESIRERVSTIYNLIQENIEIVEETATVRSTFKQDALVYSSKSNSWLPQTSCLWHDEIEVGGHLPIAGMYPDLKRFFVDTLGVSTITDVFMMRQLASVAGRREKDVGEIKSMMLSTSALLNIDTNISKFEKSIEILQQSSYLPCQQPGGQLKFCTPAETFYIVDNQYVAERFQERLKMLDFTYNEVNRLHELFRILSLDKNYLTKHVTSKTTAESTEINLVLTEQFRQCAYAISCAISHRSPKYYNQATEMHDYLLNATLSTSSNISTKLVVEQDEIPIEVESTKASLLVQPHESGLHITLPDNKADRTQCMRAQLPGEIAKLLKIHDHRGERQVYRIINELELGTYDILLSEDISEASWLRKIHRPTSVPDVEPAIRTNIVVNGEIQISANYSQISQHIRHVGYTSRSGVTEISNSNGVAPLQFRALPTVVGHEDAPRYVTVLERIRVQSQILYRKFIRHAVTEDSFDDIANAFEALTLRRTIPGTTFEPGDLLAFFGTDEWLSKFRMGAAGELLAYEILRQLTNNDLTLDNWQSKIRHLVQAHELYQHVEPWQQRETADIVYTDEKNTFGSFLNSERFGDTFANWFPTWLQEQVRSEHHSLQWLFEIKTTAGPCETDFYMSDNQYNLMRRLGQESRSPREQVYCIVRVYDLLSERIGIRFFIDPWRFRDGRLKFGTTDKWKVTPS